MKPNRATLIWDIYNVLIKYDIKPKEAFDKAKACYDIVINEDKDELNAYLDFLNAMKTT